MAPASSRRLQTLQAVDHALVFRRRKSGNNAPKSVFILDDMSFAGIIPGKFNDPPVQGAFRGCLVGINFLQDSVHPLIERLLQNFFLLVR